jgi:hypothetical protein
MTMQQEPSGGSVTVVQGGADDPFTDPNATQSNGAPGSQPANINPSQQVQVVAPASAASAANVQASGAAADPNNRTFTEAEVQARVSAAQSGLDRKLNAIQQQLEEERAARARIEVESIKAQREAQASGLPEAERVKLQAIWDIEDARKAIEEREQAVKGLYLSVEGMRLLTKYGTYVTEEDILDYKGDPTALEAHVKAVAFDRSQDPDWKKPEATGATAASTAAKPAGAGAVQDIGSQGAPPQGVQFLTTQGQESMAQNIKTLFADERQVVPWNV